MVTSDTNCDSSLQPSGAVGGGSVGGGMGVLVAGTGMGVLVAGTVGVAALTWVNCTETVCAAAVEATSCGEGCRGKLQAASKAVAANRHRKKASRRRFIIGSSPCSRPCVPRKRSEEHTSELQS